MRLGNKGMSVYAGENQLFGIDVHDGIQKDQNASLMEFATEYGMNTSDVRKLKKHLERN
nr:hypothetical protein [uncultured Bacillus sp.]